MGNEKNDYLDHEIYVMSKIEKLSKVLLVVSTVALGIGVSFLAIDLGFFG